MIDAAGERREVICEQRSMRLQRVPDFQGERVRPEFNRRTLANAADLDGGQWRRLTIKLSGAPHQRSPSRMAEPARPLERLVRRHARNGDGAYGCFGGGTRHGFACVMSQMTTDMPQEPIMDALRKMTINSGAPFTAS